MTPDPKKLAMMIVAGKKPEADAEVGADVGADDSGGVEAAGQDAMDAIKSGDVAGFVSAMKAFLAVAG